MLGIRRMLQKEDVMKNLIDPRLPRVVLRPAILDTFVALSDKWIFEVCCHASSQRPRPLPGTGQSVSKLPWKTCFNWVSVSHPVSCYPAAGKLIIEIWSPYILTSLFWCSICKIWRVSKMTAISIKLMIILSTISASLARLNCNLFEFVWTWGWRSGIKRNRQSHQQGLRAHFLPQISSGLPRCPGQPAHHQKKWYLICYFAVSRKSLHL